MGPKPAPGRVSKQALVSAGSCTKVKFLVFWEGDDRALVGPPGGFEVQKYTDPRLRRRRVFASISNDCAVAEGHRTTSGRGPVIQHSEHHDIQSLS